MKIKHFKFAYITLAYRLLILTNPSENDWNVAYADVLNIVTDKFQEWHVEIPESEREKCCKSLAALVLTGLIKLECGLCTQYSDHLAALYQVRKSLMTNLSDSPLSEQIIGEWFEEYTVEELRAAVY